MQKFEARRVTGRDANGTTYDTAIANVRTFATLDGAATDVAQSTDGYTWDIFDPRGFRRARVHVDGGIDHT